MRSGIPHFEGDTDGTAQSFAVIAARFNIDITERLVNGAKDCLMEHGVAEKDINLFWCPGALEIPAILARISKHGFQGRKYDGVIVIGCVIRGDTDHYTYVCSESMRGVGQVAAAGEIAVGNAILTVENQAQAEERAGERLQNKGWEAALAALEMANLFRKVR